LAWRPENESILQKKIITVARTDGYLEQFQASNGKSLSLVDAYADVRAGLGHAPGLLCLDYSPDGSRFVASGKDPDIFMFDEMSKKKVVTFARNRSHSDLIGHTSRICAVKYLPDTSKATLLSGSWDNTVQFWDERRPNRSIGSIVGPQVSSCFALDVHDNKLLVGSFRGSDQLHLYDLRTRTLLENLSRAALGKNVTSIPPELKSDSLDSSLVGGGCASQLSESSLFPAVPAGLHIYSAQFSCNGKYIAIGGSNSDGSYGMLRVLDTLDLTWTGTGCKCAVFSNTQENVLCAVGSEGKVSLIKL